jgi:hypothetical protein
MAPQTIKVWIPAPQITNRLFFGPLHQFVPFKWMESESRAQHVTLLAKMPKNVPLLVFEIPPVVLILFFQQLFSIPENNIWHSS